MLVVQERIEMNDRKHEDLTQTYSTWGNKLLQHTDVLYEMQNKRYIRPITIQLSLTEACDSDCPFCSVSNRPIKNYMTFDVVKKTLSDFKRLGAKSVELTGGGNPMLYKDKNTGHTIDDVVKFAHELRYDVGIITNSEKLSRLSKETHDMINWIRISLIKLDEGKQPEDYDFCGFPYEKLGFSYIIYDECTSSPIRKRSYEGTSEKTIEKIAKLVELHEGKIKFVRFAGNCLIKSNNLLVRKRFGDIVDANDKYKKFFLKTIDENDSPYNDGCYVGMIRPYVASSSDGLGHKVYTCTSYVLNNRTYDEAHVLCDVNDIVDAWNEMNESFKINGYPYEIKQNSGKNWESTCKYCYYKNNNQLLHAVAVDVSEFDKNFP